MVLGMSSQQSCNLATLLKLVILDDASVRDPFSEDRYVRRRPARSVMCLPLVNQTKLTGLLYLENNLRCRN